MEGFMHWYNSHRRTIWIIIGVAILIFVMIKVINSGLKQKEQPRNAVSTNTIKMNSPKKYNSYNRQFCNIL